MAEFIENISTSLQKFTVLDAIDILLVTGIIYGLIRITSRTRARQVLKGLGILIVLAQLFSMLRLPTISWLLNQIVTAGDVLLVILFTPEIRRALEKIGRGKIFNISSFSDSDDDNEKVIESLQKAILNMSMRKIGALIVFEGKTGLQEIIDSGTTVEATISSELVENVFYPGAPMHDGAMIIKKDKIVAAGCFLPLSDNKQISSELGTRHRASLGISEVSDAVVIIVSEETGVISRAHDGVLTRYLDRKTLKEALEDIYTGKSSPINSVIEEKRKKKGGKK